MKRIIVLIFSLLVGNANATPVTYTFSADDFRNTVEELPEYEGADLPVPFTSLSGSYTLDGGTLLDFYLRLGEVLFTEDDIELHWYSYYYVIDGYKDHELSVTHKRDGFLLWIEPSQPEYMQMMYAYRDVESIYRTKDLSINRSPFPWMTNASGIDTADFGEGWVPFTRGTGFRRETNAADSGNVLRSQFSYSSFDVDHKSIPHSVTEPESHHLLALGLLIVVGSSSSLRSCMRTPELFSPLFSRRLLRQCACRDHQRAIQGRGDPPALAEELRRSRTSHAGLGALAQPQALAGAGWAYPASEGQKSP